MKFSFSHCAEFVVRANKENNSSRRRALYAPTSRHRMRCLGKWFQCSVTRNGFLDRKKSHLGKLISFGVVCGLDKKMGKKIGEGCNNDSRPLRRNNSTSAQSVEYLGGGGSERNEQQQSTKEASWNATKNVLCYNLRFFIE